MELSDCNYVILHRNRAQCALNKKILNLLNEENFLEKAAVELVYKFYEKSYREYLKNVSRLLKYDSNFFVPQTYIYTYTNTDHFTPLVLHMWDNNILDIL